VRGLIFDSGVGGLSVTADIRARLPALKLDYMADDDFRPYGNKSAAALQQRLPGLLWSLRHMLGSDFIVLACNTASTTALPAIRAALDVPVIGVVPAIKPAAKASRTRHIGVLGTPGTVKRAYVDQLIADHAGDCRVSLKGSTALVEQAEAKLAGQDTNRDILEDAIAPFLKHSPPIDHIVLACTHFPLLKSELSAAAGDTVTWIDSGEAIARRVETITAHKTSSQPQLQPQSLPQPRGHQIAFTSGRDISAARQAIFKTYGFSRLISLA
jgi:glutamate racemase